MEVCFYQVCSILSLKVWDSTDKNFFKVKWCHLKENIFFALIIAPFHNRFLEVFWSLAGNSFAALFNCKVMFLKWTIYRNVHVIFVCFFCLLLFFVFLLEWQNKKNIQWNLSKADTYGTEVFVCFRELSALERFELKSSQI